MSLVFFIGFEEEEVPSQNKSETPVDEPVGSTIFVLFRSVVHAYRHVFSRFLLHEQQQEPGRQRRRRRQTSSRMKRTKRKHDDADNDNLHKSKNTTHIFDQIVHVAEICEPQFPEKELEIRLVWDTTHSVPKEDFMHLFRLMQEADTWERKLPEEITMDLFFSGSQRGTIFQGNKKSAPVLIEKTRLGRHVLKHEPSGYRLVVTSKREQQLKSNHLNWPKPNFVRSKRRYRFVHRHVFCDMTLVYTADTQEKTLTSEPTFEIELELRPEAEDLHPRQVAATLIESALGLIKDLRPDIEDIYQGLEVLS